MISNDKQGPECRPRIDVDDYFDLRSWAKRFGVTANDVRRAVARVGDHPRDVEQYLRFDSASAAAGKVDGPGGEAAAADAEPRTAPRR
jgi:hypothetical protein